MPEYQKLLTGYSYVEGKSYGDYKDGDKLAGYGLGALVAGGAAYAAAKTGILGAIILFFKKFLKIIVVGVVAVGIAIKRFFGGLIGRKDS